MGFQRSWKLPPRRLDARAIADLCDAVELRIIEKIRLDFRFEMELMKNDMVVKTMRAIVGVPRNVGTKDGYEESLEDFEVFGFSDQDRTNCVERSMEDRVG